MKAMKPKKGKKYIIRIIFRTDPGREIVEKAVSKVKGTLLKWDPAIEATMEAPDLMRAILLMASLCCEKGKVKDSIVAAQATLVGGADGALQTFSVADLLYGFRSTGSCFTCGHPALPGTTRCEEHTGRQPRESWVN